jgi:hypothetical protein
VGVQHAQTLLVFGKVDAVVHQVVIPHAKMNDGVFFIGAVDVVQFTHGIEFRLKFGCGHQNVTNEPPGVGGGNHVHVIVYVGKNEHGFRLDRAHCGLNDLQQLIPVSIYKIVDLVLILKHVFAGFVHGRHYIFGHRMKLRVDRQFKVEFLGKFAQMHRAPDQIA